MDQLFGSICLHRHLGTWRPVGHSFSRSPPLSWDLLTLESGRSLMRKRFLLKLSFRTFAQLKALIFVKPWGEKYQPVSQEMHNKQHGSWFALLTGSCKGADVQWLGKNVFCWRIHKIFGRWMMPGQFLDYYFSLITWFGILTQSASREKALAKKTIKRKINKK